MSANVRQSLQIETENKTPSVATKSCTPLWKEIFQIELDLKSAHSFGNNKRITEQNDTIPVITQTKENQEESITKDMCNKMYSDGSFFCPSLIE